MEKAVVIYASKYGSTKQYAEWIADELACTLLEHTKANIDEVKKYDIIIFGGGLYAGGIKGISFITKNYEVLKEKKVIVFTVGLADPKNKEQFVPILRKNFTNEMIDKIAVFHFRGSMDYKKLGIIHQSMMAMMKSMVKKKDDKMDDESRVFLETYGKKVDFKDILSIKPLLSYVENLSLTNGGNI